MSIFFFQMKTKQSLDIFGYFSLVYMLLMN
jgi:hypothetical protein